MFLFHLINNLLFHNLLLNHNQSIPRSQSLTLYTISLVYHLITNSNMLNYHLHFIRFWWHSYNLFIPLPYVWYCWHSNRLLITSISYILFNIGSFPILWNIDRWMTHQYYYCWACAAATPPTQFGSEKARGRSYLRLLVDFCRTILTTNHSETVPEVLTSVKCSWL